MRKTPIDIDNTAEVITAVVLKYSTLPVNFDALYGSVSYYITFAEPHTLEGLSASIKVGADIGASYESDLVFDSDIFN